MPDVTVSFTDAQWTRIVAATSNIKRINEDGDVDAAYLTAKWEKQVERWVIDYEKSQGTTSSWG
jgi:hypothetical protein